MLKIEEMAHGEMLALLLRAAYGHLACARDNRPYVVPMNYTFDLQFIYFFTTEGTKTEMIEANNAVCFQVEEFTDPLHWRSVMVTGQAERLERPADVEHAMQLITGHNPTLAPALNETKIGAWTRLNNVVIYRLRPDAIYGRKTA
ncbi:MAG: pyridoxamine 5'-phosphate oxidase family protein [Acidobacteria bacterium]|nr:MAG: pyridoxamine 5'-phosphate oxidase family protein [Acidobacteriota bacterium]